MDTQNVVARRPVILVVDPEATAVQIVSGARTARVFAIGDVRRDSVKRVASAVGKGAVCVRLVHEYLAV